jgi:carbon monoxide dehydrogenase subunit G
MTQPTFRQPFARGEEVETSYVSSVIEAPVAEVWHYLRDFAGLPKYFEGAKSVTIADGKSSDTVGCVRVAVLADGSTVRERLLALSDADHSASYTLLTEGLALTDYVATVKLRPITDGDRTFIEWSSTYEVPGDDPASVHRFVEDTIYLAAMRGLQELLPAKSPVSQP